MNLTTRLNDILRAILKRTKDKTMIEPIDTDTPVEMGKTSRTNNPVRNTTRAIKNAAGEDRCAKCGGKLVQVKPSRTRACWNCGAKVID